MAQVEAEAPDREHTRPQPRLRAWFVALLASAAVGCGGAQTPKASARPESVTVAVWWSPVLELATLAEISTALARPFAYPLPVTLPGGGEPRTLASCNDYLEARPLGYEPQDDQSFFLMKHLGASCQTLLLLQRARASSDQRLAQLLGQPDALNRLPAALAPAPSPLEQEQRAKAIQAGATLARYDASAKLLERGDTKLTFASADANTTVEAYVLADLDADGSQDAVIRSLSHGAEGSWFEMHLWVVAMDDSGQLHVVRELLL